MKTLASKLLRFFFVLLLSFVGMFFGLFNILFSDIFGLNQRAESYLYVLGLYFVFAFMLTLAWPQQRKSILWWLAAPVLALSTILFLLEPVQIIVIFGAASFALLGIWFGGSAGRRLRKRQLRTLSTKTKQP